MSVEQSYTFTKMAYIAKAKEAPPCDKTLYRSIVGALLFVSRGTRPDIETAVHMCATASHDPTIHHLKLVKRVLRYVNTTKHMCMTYDARSAVVTGYTDSNYGSREQDSRSRTGYCLRVGPAMSGSAMAIYKPRLQKDPSMLHH